MMKWILRIFIVCVVLLISVLLLRNLIIRTSLQTSMRKMTGFDLVIKDIDVGLLKPVVQVRDMQLFNPVGFEEKNCAIVPEIYVHYAPLSFIQGKPHIYDIRLEISEVYYVKNSKGETNLEKLQAAQQKIKGTSDPSAPPSKESDFKIQIDRLELTMGKVHSIDYTKMRKGEPKRETVNIGIKNQVFRNLQDTREVVLIALMKVATSGVDFLNFSVSQLQKSLGSVTDDSGNLINSTTQIIKGVGEKIGNFFSKDKE